MTELKLMKCDRCGKEFTLKKMVYNPSQGCGVTYTASTGSCGCVGYGDERKYGEHDAHLLILDGERYELCEDCFCSMVFCVDNPKKVDKLLEE